MYTLTAESTHARVQTPISVLLIDDDYEFRKGLQFLLSFYSSTSTMQFDVVGHAASVEQALALYKQQVPSLVLLDLELAQETGIDFLIQKRELPQDTKSSAKTLVISAHCEDEWVYQTMKAGAHGYLFKENLSSQLCEAISVIMKDGVYLSRETITSFFRMFNFYSRNPVSSSECQGHDIHLTERERHVLQLVVEGASNEAIARKLHITVGTVKCYLTAIFNKLDVRSRTQAAIKALKLGVISA